MPWCELRFSLLLRAYSLSEALSSSGARSNHSFTRCRKLEVALKHVANRTGRQGLGSALLRDEILRTTQSAQIAGIRAILVHVISVQAKQYYLERGFLASPTDAMTLMLPLADADQILRK